MGPVASRGKMGWVLPALRPGLGDHLSGGDCIGEVKVTSPELQWRPAARPLRLSFASRPIHDGRGGVLCSLTRYNTGTVVMRCYERWRSLIRTCMLAVFRLFCEVKAKRDPCTQRARGLRVGSGCCARG